MCVHLDGLNAEHKFRVWVTILGHTSLSLSLSQNLQNVNSFSKIKGIIQNACYILFSTDLNKIFYIKDIYI